MRFHHTLCCTVLCRCSKHWLEGPKAGQSELLAHLPGFPDNIRLNPRGRFWVAIHKRRNALIGEISETGQRGTADALACHHSYRRERGECGCTAFLLHSPQGKREQRKRAVWMHCLTWMNPRVIMTPTGKEEGCGRYGC